MRKLIAFAVIFMTAVTAPQHASARDRFIEGGPQSLAETRSLGEVIRSAQGPVHISYVHGMRADGPGASAAFRAELLRRFGGSAAPRARRFIDLGARPARAMIGSAPIWPSDAAWAASRPFVDRYQLNLRGGAIVIVDEVNWWPLLFPIKCRFLVLPEHDLSGNEPSHLRLCAGRGPAGEAGLFHPWLSAQELDQALDTDPRSGGGARVNSTIKRQIFNWGLADAVIALGPMRHYLNRTMQSAFALAAEGTVASTARDHVLITESLGSFVVLDALSADTPAVESYLAGSRIIYFFANQFALLEFARIANLPDGTATPAAGPEPSPLEQLQTLARTETPGRRRLQIVALSDPSDMLTYRVPQIEGATVVNIYVRNVPRGLGLLADPIRAHTGHVGTSGVWDVLLRSPGD
jgi:hypothetical protein